LNLCPDSSSFIGLKVFSNETLELTYLVIANFLIGFLFKIDFFLPRVESPASDRELIDVDCAVLVLN
jgi:hypothetical protein